MALNPMHQFEVYKIGPEINIGGLDLSFTNASLFMFISSTLILIGLLLSLSMAVILPEIQISKNQNSYAYIISPEYDSMVNRQRRGYLVLGLLAVSTFFVSIQTMSVPLFIFHLVLDCVFGIYAFLSFQVRRSMQVQNNLTMGNQVENMVEEESYFKEAV